MSFTPWILVLPLVAIVTGIIAYIEPKLNDKIWYGAMSAVFLGCTVIELIKELMP